MGATYVDVTVRNPADLGRSWTGSFLVDTGAYDSMAPRSALEAIGLEPMSSREYELADGSIVTYDIGAAVLEFEGVLVANMVVFGDDGVEPLLAVTALESGGFEVDPRRQELKRLPGGAFVARALHPDLLHGNARYRAGGGRVDGGHRAVRSASGPGTRADFRVPP